MNIIQTCDNWYSNRAIEDFHKRKNLNNVDYELSRMNFAKRCCADDANLCEIVSVVPEQEGASEAFIKELLERNRFDVQYRKQLEKTSATGTAGAYLYLKNATYIKAAEDTILVKDGKICINYVDADCIIPLTVENELVTECAFCSTNQVRGKEKTVLVIFTLDEAGHYLAETVVFDELGKCMEEECSILQLGEVKPFSIMTNAEVNNLDNMAGYGLPKVFNSIPLFQAVDLCYNLLYGDLSKGDKLVFINELLACIQKDKDGNPYLTPQQKEIFVLLGQDGGKLPEEKTLVQEYNPEIRVDAITKAFELVLSLLSMSFGYGSKKYTFEKIGQIKTATECMIDNQQAMQELNRQRKNASDYITDIIHAAMWFSNQFHGTAFNLEEPLSIEFDDSVITDRQSILESMRADAVTFSEVPWLKLMYLKEKYNLSEEEAKKYIEEGIMAQEDEDDMTD